jgi:thioredoxin-like negative regulator of GroEL
MRLLPLVNKQVMSFWRLEPKNLVMDRTFTAKPMPKDQALARLGMLNRRCMDKEARHADRLFKQALALNEACAPAHLGLGLAAIEAGKYGEAKPHILKAAELDPDDYVAQFLASQLVVFGGSVTPEQRTQAREFLLRGLARSPGNLDALSRLVMMCSFDGTAMDEVTALILTAIEQYPSKRDLPLKWAEALIRYRKTPMAARVLEAISIEGLDESSKQKYQTLRTRIQDAAATDRKNEALKRLAAGSIEEGLKGLEEALALAASDKVKAEIKASLDEERAKLDAQKASEQAPVSAESMPKKPKKK